MNSENFLNLCYRTNNLNEIKQYYNKYEDNINIHYNDNQLFRMLCKENKIDILKYIYKKTKYLDWNFKILSNDDIYTNEDLFCFCARYAYLEIAKFIYLRDKENIDLYAKNNEPFVLASQENHLLYLKWLYSLDKRIDIFSDEIILEQFIFKKNYLILEWYVEVLYENNINKDQIYNQLNYIFTNLCKNDEIELLIKIKDKLNIDLNEYDLNNFLLNSKKKSILYLLENYKFSNIEIEHAYCAMIYLNDLDVIRKFEDICKSQNCDLINYKDIFLISLCENKLDVCKYIYENFCENCIENNINSINNMNNLQYTTLLNFVCNTDINFRSLKYIYNILINNNIHIDDSNKVKIILNFCRRNKYYEALFLYTKIKNKLSLKLISKIEIERMLGISKIKIIRWLCKISHNNFNELGLIISNLLFSNKEKIRMEQFNLIKLFIRKDSYLKLDDYEINTLLKLDNLKILEYVTYVDDSILQKKNMIFDVLRINNLDIIKWYFSKRCIYMKYDLYKCFKIVCKRGNLEIIKYIYDKYNLLYYVKENLNIFNIACKSNNIHTIFWIYNILDKNTVLKLKDYEWEYIILSRNYQIIRWILETKNIVVNKKAGLKYSIQNGLFDIVKLLCDFLSYDDILKILHLYEGLNIRQLLLNCDLDILNFFRNDIYVPILKKKVDYNLIEDICIKQDYEILDWIRQYFNIDSLFRLDNDKLFRKLCNMRKISIIRYMMSIFSFYSYKIENDIIIPLIKDSIEYFYENKELDNIVKYYNIKTEKKMDNFEYSCIICYNSANMKTSCNHDYCDECLLKWYIFKNKSCPYCRDEIVMNESILYN